MKYCLLCEEDVEQEIELLEFLFRSPCICRSCKQQLHVVKKSFEKDEMKVFVLYEYEAFFENIMYQFKEGKDVALAPLFLEGWERWFERKYRGYTIVFAPSAHQKTLERGFLPLAKIYENVRLPKRAPFVKVHEQKGKTAKERKIITQEIALYQKEIGCKLVFVDDVMTTGETAKQCVRLLKELGNHVEIFVLSMQFAQK